MTEVIELRRYTLHPGQRDVLIDLFDREFVESQENLGMPIIGQFRDLDDPDQFVWVRGFADMAARAEGLTAFYGGPVWRAHRAAANATMIDIDNVLLLRPTGPETGFTLDPAARDTPPSSLVLATIHHLAAPADGELDRTVLALLAKVGIHPLARLRTEYAENNFPALPVRAGEHTYVWFAAFGSRAEIERVAQLREWAELPGRVEPLTLAPTPRSLLR
jgi:NIPSNAP